MRSAKICHRLTPYTRLYRCSDRSNHMAFASLQRSHFNSLGGMEDPPQIPVAYHVSPCCRKVAGRTHNSTGLAVSYGGTILLQNRTRSAGYEPPEVINRCSSICSWPLISQFALLGHGSNEWALRKLGVSQRSNWFRCSTQDLLLDQTIATGSHASLRLLGNP